MRNRRELGVLGSWLYSNNKFKGKLLKSFEYIKSNIIIQVHNPTTAFLNPKNSEYQIFFKKLVQKSIWKIWPEKVRCLSVLIIICASIFQYFKHHTYMCGYIQDFPDGSDSKESACNTGDMGSTPGLKRSPGEAKSYPLQYSCLDNSMGRGAWQAAVHGVTKSWTQLND